MKHTATCFAMALLFFAMGISSCSSQKHIGKSAQRTIIRNEKLVTAHVGIALYDAAAKKFIYNYNGDKYFIPASNNKLLTCYAAMKYLGDSLVGLRYVDKGNGVIEAEPAGDPTLLHPAFVHQPVIAFLKQQKKILLTDANWREKAWGYGWAWDDYNDDYMAERSALPLYGNLVHFTNSKTLKAFPSYFQDKIEGTDSLKRFRIRRELSNNHFILQPAASIFTTTDIPFYTGEKDLAIHLLKEAVNTEVQQVHFVIDRWPDVKIIHSQPTDSMLKIMMYESDNFFAEQSLLMVSNEKLTMMNDAAIIDTLLKTDYADLPQKPKWVDGSGLSRYNLVSPEDFVSVLEKMRNDFSWNRITSILPSGNEGTLKGYYKNYGGHIYAKTGSLSNNISLSGYIITKKNHPYTFSVMVNNHQAAASDVRHAVEAFLTSIIDRY
ncbi:MAG: D-alanyl-D-alanine carboxypeptidase [Bacteroidota bacterium]|nr:D-alanyl-D-alanine carboxypeptidase [Bacteroidota bacterium]